jgi:hypothetical protein
VPAVKARPEEFIHIFVNKEDWLQKFLEYIISQPDTDRDPVIYDTLLELYLREDKDVSPDYLFVLESFINK